MGSRRHKNWFYRTLYKLGHSPLALLETAQTACLGWILLAALVGYGGFLGYGVSMVGVSLGVFVLTVLHALAAPFRKEPPGIAWVLILPVPFLLYAWLHYSWISPVPWSTALYLTVWVQAYTLYFALYNRIKSSKSGLSVLGLCLFVVVLGLLAAFFQYYIFPEWMVSLDRARNPAYAHGAAGFLMDPSHLTALLILYWPVSVLMAWMPRFNGPWRILNAAFALVIPMGVLVSSHHWGLLIFIGLFLVLPLFLSADRRVRRRYWTYGTLLMLMGLLVFWFGTEGLHQRMQYYSATMDSAWDWPMLQQTVDLFLRAPFFGHGLGAYPLAVTGMGAGGPVSESLYPVSGLLGILAEMGLVGAGLLFLPLGCLMGLSLKKWKQIPFASFDKDIERRLKHLSSRRRSRSRLRRTYARTPSTKIVLGGLSLGLIGFFLYEVFDEAIYFPLQVFILAASGAFYVAFLGGFKRVKTSRRMGLVVGMIPLLLATWATVFGVPRFYAQYLVYTTTEELNFLLAEPDRIFQHPSILLTLEANFSMAAELDPGNADALMGLARARLAGTHAEMETLDEVAEKAAAPLLQALEMAPKYWMGHYNLARTEAMRGGDEEAIRTYLLKAHDLAPGRAEPVALLGTMTLIRDLRDPGGRSLLEEALSLNPHYKPAIEFLRWLDLGVNQGDQATSSSRGSLLSEAMIAEQFEPSLPPVNRVTGAGLPVFD